MLTATYTLVALSVEQTKVRVSLQSLHKFLQSNLLHRSSLSRGQVECVCDTLKRLYEAYHWRKLDKFLIPAVRRASTAAAELLGELEALSQTAAEAMAAAVRSAGGAALEGEARVARFCALIDRFCAALLERLEREEHELFPVARAVIPSETWFAIANQMLAHDAYHMESRGGQAYGGARRAFRGPVDHTMRQGSPLTIAH